MHFIQSLILSIKLDQFYSYDYWPQIHLSYVTALVRVISQRIMVACRN